MPVEKMLFEAAYLNLPNLFRLLFDRNFHRINVAVQVYDEVLFRNATFENLLVAQRANSDRPFVIANSTELEIGSQFQWTQDQFDPICSNLQPIHVATAVAASSNFPVLLPPTILSKYDAAMCGYKTPAWLPNARNDAYLDPIRARYGMELEAYLDSRRRYLHLLDGGIECVRTIHRDRRQRQYDLSRAQVDQLERDSGCARRSRGRHPAPGERIGDERFHFFERNIRHECRHVRALAVEYESRRHLVMPDGVQPGAQRLPRRRIEWDEPLLASLPHHAHDARAEVDVLHVEADQLAQPEPGCVEQLEDPAVTPP